MKPHAFVAMPFGSKPNVNGELIDFNRVYSEYIKPALEKAGLEVFRADEEQRAGDIKTDMFQELLMADLVVVDLTIDNPNVWYELGVRHALRVRGVVLVCGGQVTTAFDLYTDRKLRYEIKDGGLDPATLEINKQNLTTMVKETMESWHGRKTSPVYHLMLNLREPDWKSFRIGDVLEFWEQHDAWENRIELARQSSRIGDILLLADEAPVAAFRSEAWIKAGVALRKAGHFAFALEQLERGLEVEPNNIKGLQEKGVCLQRLALQDLPEHSLDRARQHYKKMLEEYPDDAEIWALYGRVDKDAWVDSWQREGSSPEEMREDAEYEDALLRSAIDSYFKGYRVNLAHYYSGINALALMHLYQHLTGETLYEEQIANMAGAIRFAAEYKTNENELYWAKATIGDLEVLTGTPDTVKRAYKKAIAQNDKDWFALDSCRAQLELLKPLGFLPNNIEAGIAVFDRALQRLTKPKESWQPRKVFLFSGHMIDLPDRPEPRFPADNEQAAGQKIAEYLDQQDAGPEDLALTQGACGGDLLFSESCLEREVRVHWLQPFHEPEFIGKSVIRGGEGWRDRYFSAKSLLPIPPQTAPEFLGEPPQNVDTGFPYERCNKWLLYTALSCGIEKVHFISLWNGGGGDGPGGTAHMYNEVKKRTGKVKWIKTHDL